MHAVKEVEPFAPLRPLASHVVDAEDHVLDVELHLHHGKGDCANDEVQQQAVPKKDQCWIAVGSPFRM